MPTIAVVASSRVVKSLVVERMPREHTQKEGSIEAQRNKRGQYLGRQCVPLGCFSACARPHLWSRARLQTGQTMLIDFWRMRPSLFWSSALKDSFFFFWNQLHVSPSVSSRRFLPVSCSCV